MEAEKANQLSILPNYEAVCRLIHCPGGDKRLSLIERHIVTEVRKKEDYNPEIAAIVRQRSRQLALSQDEVEREIAQRSLGALPDQDVDAAEKIG